MLRTQGVRPQQVIGYCAWALGLVLQPRAMSAGEALAVFSWQRVRAHAADVRVPDDLPARLLCL